MPEIESSKVYDLPMFKFRASTLFRYCSHNVPLSLGQSVYQIPLIQQSDIDWGLEHGFKFVHIGLIQFRINPLVRPGLNTSVLSCIIDSHHNQFSDAIISGFQAPLHNGPVWSSTLPRFQVSLTDPYISSLLQGYVQFSGFDMARSSKIAQLHTTICLRFVTTTMQALNPKLIQRVTNESVVVGSGNVTPLTLGFAKLTIPDEWSADYQPMQSKIAPAKAQQLIMDRNELGDKVLRIGRSKSLRVPDLERKMSSLNTSISDSYPRKSTSSSSSTSYRTPVYKPVSSRSKLDDHLLFHQKGLENCYFCQKGIPSQDESSGKPPVKHIPSAYKNFRTYQSKVEHSGQHSDCSECQEVAVPLIKMINYTLPRGDKDKSATLPQKSLGPGNHTPSFKNNLVAVLDFIQYRKANAEKSQDVVRIQNYANYQSVCLAQNLDDMAQDIMQTKSHMNGLHSEIDNLEQNQETLKSQLVQILEKLDTIQTAIHSLKESYDKEKVLMFMPLL